MIELIFSVIFLLIFFINYLIKKKDIFDPLYLFLLILFSSYFIYALKLSKLQSNYGFKSVIFILSVVISFYLGTLLRNNRRKLKEYVIDNKKFKKSIYILFFVILFSYIMHWITLGLPPLFSNLDRSKYFVSGFGTIYLLIQSLSFLLFYDILVSKSLGYKSYFLLIIVLFMIISFSNKFQLFYLICQFIVLYNMYVKKISIKSFAYLFAIVIVVFVIYYNYIYSDIYISNDLLYTISGMKFSKKLSFLTTPYLYVSYNYDNLFNYMFNCKNVLGYGYYSLQAILKQANIYSIFVDTNYMDSIWKSNLQYSWLTTGTLFREFYMDFSYIGVVVGTLILGKICKKSYISFNTNKNLFSGFFYSTNIVSLFFLFFTNNFITVEYLLNLFCVYIIFMICVGVIKYE